MTIRERELAPPIRVQDGTGGEVLRKEYLAEVFAYCYRRLGCREDAEDATAEVFQAALRHLRRRGVQDPRLWLFGIARRQVAMTLRQHRRRKEVPLSLDLAGGLNPNPERAEAIAEIRRLVLTLPDDQREALMLQYLEDLDHKQIAVVMGKSPTAINSLLQRARARLHRDGHAFFTTPKDSQEEKR